MANSFDDLPENARPNPETPGPIWIDKREVAARQIAGAILMFFEGQEPVATHSVVAAAHQILIDLGAREDIHTLADQYAEVSQLSATGRWPRRASSRLVIDPASHFQASSNPAAMLAHNEATSEPASPIVVINTTAIRLARSAYSIRSCPC